jgi:hypothetical protein
MEKKRIVFAFGRTALAAAALGVGLAHSGPPLNATACQTCNWNNVTGYYCSDDPVYNKCDAPDPNVACVVDFCCGGGTGCY